MLTLLRNRDYFWLWLGQTVSNLGDEVRTWALSYWIFQASDRNPVIFALSYIAAVAPSLLLAPFAGVLVDRWDRRKVMIISDLLRGGLSLLMIVAAVTGQYLLALPLVFLAACVANFFDPARSAMIPRVVPREQLVQANSLSQSTTTLLRLAGPGLGTVIFTLLGPVASFVADAASFFLSAACIMLVKTSGSVPAKPTADQRFWPELQAGLRFVWSSRPLRVVMITFTILMMGGGAINSLEIFLVRDILHLPVTMLALPNTVQPLASLLTALAVGTLAAKLRRPLMLSPLGTALCTLGIGLVAGAQNLYWVIAGAVAVGVGNVIMSIGGSTIGQLFVPDEMRGRVGSILGVLPTAAMILSAGIAGAVAQSISPRWIMGAATLLLGLATLISYAGLKGVATPTGAGTVGAKTEVAG